jgi:hypothetical protein
MAVKHVAVMVVLALLLCGCDLVGGSATGGNGGYLLEAEEGPSVGPMFVRYEPAEPAGNLEGYMYFAHPGSNPSGVYLQTERVTGSVDGDSVVFRLESNPDAEYVGTVEGDTMTLRNGLASWEGESATLEDFGAAAEELATDSGN